jgi:enolase-phosphatase E1
VAEREIALLLDIEGTTTPISFVSEVLFPYARRHGREFILSHLTDEEIRGALRQLQADNVADVIMGAPSASGLLENSIEAILEYYAWLMDRDRKSTALKTMQGRIWEQGYARGELRSVVFPDVRPAFERWHREGRTIAIYSSGSVLAQRQLFEHTSEGDLEPFIRFYFDTSIGSKRSTGSYAAIGRELGVPPDQVLFVSDALPELDAAYQAGMRTKWCVRPGNAQQVMGRHASIRSFDDLL